VLCVRTFIELDTQLCFERTREISDPFGHFPLYHMRGPNTVAIAPYSQCTWLCLKCPRLA